MAKLIDLNGLAHVYSIIKGMLADKLGKNDTAVNASKVNNLTVETAVPKNAKFTDTVYTHPSTHPASMITGLSTVATSGSYNDLTNKPTIPSAYTLPNATSSTLGGVKIGSNISVSSGTISITKSNVTSALGYTPPTSDTVYDNATATTAGLMSASDKVKLNNIADNANNYIHPPTHPASIITGLASVATSGSYSDLSNKPTIPVVPTKVSAFFNDAGYLTQHQSLDDYAKKTDVNTALANKLGINDTAAAAIKDDAGNTISTTYASKADVSALLSTKLGVTATAYAATRDGAGNNIVNTYAKKTDIPNITVDSSLSSTSTNPVQNKAVKTAIDTVTASIPTKVSTLENDAGYLTQHQSLDGYAKTSVDNTWTAQQIFNDLILKRERYTTYVVNGTSYTPTTSTIFCTATGAFTLNLATLAGALSAGQSSVFTAYFAANANYTLTITNAGTIKYVGNASDVAITSAGLLLNIMMLKDASGNVTSIVQASKLS